MKNLIKVTPYILCVLILFFTPFISKNLVQENQLPSTSPTHKFVLTLWNVDVFEGGTGSRSDFLNEVSVEFNKDGVLVMVVSHTKESAINSINSGVLPDMISFGVGVDFVKKYAKSLPKISFLGGEVGGQIFAYPWCVGGYFLIRKTNDNQPIDRLFVSQNTYNLPFGAIYEAKIEAEKREYLRPLDAYTAFLKGDKSCALLGTQRDIVRLQKRGENYYADAIYGFSDVVQYISVFANDSKRYKKCVEFCEFLISEKTQKNLSKISMGSAFTNCQLQGDLQAIDFSKIDYTISPFVDSTAISAIINETGEKITNSSLLRFKNVLKRL